MLVKNKLININVKKYLDKIHYFIKGRSFG